MEVFRILSTEDLNEENDILREELVVLCERLMNIEVAKGRDVSSSESEHTVALHAQIGQKEAEVTRLRLEVLHLRAAVNALERMQEEAHDTTQRLNRELLETVTYRALASTNERKWTESEQQRQVLESEVGRLHLLNDSLSVQVNELEQRSQDLTQRLAAVTEEKAKLHLALEASKLETALVAETANRYFAEHESTKEELQIQQHATQLMQVELNQLHSKCTSQAREIQRLTMQWMDHHAQHAIGYDLTPRTPADLMDSPSPEGRRLHGESLLSPSRRPTVRTTTGCSAPSPPPSKRSVGNPTRKHEQSDTAVEGCFCGPILF